MAFVAHQEAMVLNSGHTLFRERGNADDMWVIEKLWFSIQAIHFFRERGNVDDIDGRGVCQVFFYTTNNL